MRTIDTSIDIDAAPAAVWAVLADTGRYPEWNPFVRSLSGDLHAGARLTVQIGPPGKSAMTLKPKVLAAVPGRGLRWVGRLGLPGIFDVEHAMELEPLPEGKTRFHHHERFRGVLVPFVGGVLRDTERGFTAMNAALKARVEAR
jgi:hypothetical protein